MDKDSGSSTWWDNKYAQSDGFLFGKDPSPFLSDNAKLLKKGETLDLAMGEGRNAAFLAAQGFQVSGIDFSEVATNRAKALAYEQGVDIEIKKQSLDFFLIPLMKYDSIVVTDFHPGLSIMKNLVRGLSVGGTLLVDAYTKEQIREGQGYKPEIFECFGPNELLRELNGLKIILYNERQVKDGEYRVQCIGIKTSM